MSKWKVIAPLGVLAAGAAAAAVLLTKKKGGESAPKSGEPLGGLAAAFDDAFGNVEWQPGEAESK